MCVMISSVSNPSVSFIYGRGKLTEAYCISDDETSI